MQRLYIFTFIITLVLISLTGYYYFGLLKNEIEVQANLLSNQSTLCGRNIEENLSVYENEFRYILDSDNWEEGFRDLVNNNTKKIRIRRFYSRYKDLVDSIIFKGNNESVKLFIDNKNYFTIQSSKNSVLPQLPTANDTEKSFTSHMRLNIYDKRGDIIGHAITYFNLIKFVKEEFRNYYIGQDSWQILIHPGDGVLDYVYSEKQKAGSGLQLSEDDMDVMYKKIRQGFSGELEHSIIQDGKEIQLVSVYYPVDILGNTFGIIFSSNTNTLLDSIRNNFLIIVTLLFVTMAVFIGTFGTVLSQRNEANKNLEISKKGYSDLVNQQELLLTHSQDFVFRQDLNGKVNYVTDSIEAVLGYDKDEFHKNITQLMVNTPQNMLTINRALNSIASGKTPDKYNVEVRHKNGNVIILSVNSQIITDDLGIPHGAISLAKDISHIHKTEQLLDESRERIKFLTHNMKDVICLHDASGKFLYITPSVLEITGYTYQELVGSNPVDFLRYKNVRMIKGVSMYDQMDFTTENIFQYEMYRKDDELIWIETLTQPFKDDDGNLLHIISSSRDISERIEAENALQQSENRFRSLFEEATIGIAQLDMNWKCLAANAEMHRMLGYKAPNLKDKDLRVMIEGHAETFSNEITKQLASGELQNFTSANRILRSDEQLAWGRITISLIKDEFGRAETQIVMIEDITDKINKDNELMKAKEAAEAGSRAKSEFLATMSHEIRTPMNGVIGMTSLLSETSLNDEQQEYVDIIRTSGEALIALINDILDYSKIEAGRMDMEEAPFSLNQCVEEAIDLSANSAEKKGIELAYLIENDVPEVIQGDISRLRQVLVNLISNAIKFTFYGEVFISVKLINEFGNRLNIQFEVRDTGIGIAEEKIQYLFKAFSQIDSSTTRKFGGTGLGLAICKKIVTLMNGDIWVESKEGKGSTFIFTIEADKISDKISLNYNKEVLADKDVLIIDDNLTNLKIFKVLASKWGMNPETTHSGIDAITWLINGKKYDAILLDMQMPELNGIEVAKKIKSIPDAKDIPIVFITSFIFSEEDKKDAGGLFEAHLTKPIKQSQLFDTLYYLFYSEHKKNADKDKLMEDNSKMLAEELPIRILAAEDNPVNQKFIVHVLKKLGYTAEVAGTGKEVIELLEKRPYDLILMDIQMPVMDGLEATDVIIEKWGENRPKIIAITANALKDDRDRCLERGMDDYLSKPVTIGKIKDIIQKYGNQILDRDVTPVKPKVELTDYEESLVNKSVIDEYLSSTEDIVFYKDIVSMSSNNINENFAELKILLEEENYSAFSKKAHSIKGLSYNVGAIALGDMAKELEFSGKEKDKEKIEALMVSFTTTMESSFEVIKKLIENA